MAIYRYASTGDNTTGASWATAYTTFAGALAAATSGDDVYVDMANIAASDAELAGTTTWTIPNGVTVHIGTQNGASGITLGDMGTTYWFGNSTTGRAISIACTGSARVVGGLTVRTHGNSVITLNNTAVGSLTAQQVYLWNSHPTGGSTIRVGADETYTWIDDLIVDVDDTTPTGSQFMPIGCVECGKFTANYAGGINGLFNFAPTGTNAIFRAYGGDISSIGSGNAIVGDITTQRFECYLNNVVLNASFVMLASQTNANLSAGHLWLTDCSSSGSAVPFGYANACGEVRVDTGIYLTAGVAGRSAKITTTANCSAANPFCTPWFREYKAAATVNLSSEVLRDGSATAYTDAQFWKETLTKETGSAVATTLRTTRGTGTNISPGVGAGSWTGASIGSPTSTWSGEITIDSVVLAEDGFVQQRFGAGVASSTIYVDIGPTS